MGHISSDPTRAKVLWRTVQLQAMVSGFRTPQPNGAFFHKWGDRVIISSCMPVQPQETALHRGMTENII
jgi:hypothetical protein